MPKFKITKTFSFAHRGCDVVEYVAGSEIETDDADLIKTMTDEKWGQKARSGGAKSEGSTPADPSAQDDSSSTELQPPADSAPPTA